MTGQPDRRIDSADQTALRDVSDRAEQARRTSAWAASMAPSRCAKSALAIGGDESTFHDRIGYWSSVSEADASRRRTLAPPPPVFLSGD